MQVHCASCLRAAREQELITCLLAICIKALHTANVEYFEFRSCIFHQRFACAQVLLRDSLSLLSRGEGGVTRKTFILCVLEVKRKNEKKCPEHFLKNSKKKYPVSEPESETNMEAMKHEVQGENLETPVSGAGTGKLQLHIYIFMFKRLTR